jgi:UDP-2,3-diacylglucosamine pyrophosphatase LpxH
MHLCDVHFPFHYPPALELAYQMVKLHQPQVVVVGSDEFDLDLMSSFDADAASWDETPDILDALRTLHHVHIDRIRAAAPKAALLFIDGNHEERYSKWVNNNAPKLRNTLHQAWVDMITYNKQVYHVGAKEVEICDSLIVRHGDRHNIHAAKSLIEQEAYQVSVIAGHTHRPQIHHAEGRRFGVIGATSGCLCTLTPKYLHGKPSNWKHGTTVVQVHHPTGTISVDMPTFKKTKTHLLAITGGELLKTPTD